MARDIEEFLRKAAERRAQAQRGGQPAPAQPPRPAAQQPRPFSPPREEERVVEAVIVDPDIVIESHRGIREQASAYQSQPVDQADEKMESHLNQVFEHDLGSLRHAPSSKPGSTPEASSGEDATVAEELLRMIQTPHSLRSAIILREILERPEHRW